MTIDNQATGIPKDNVFTLTRALTWVMLLAVAGIIANILIRDGPDVAGELNFLEGLLAAGMSLLTALNMYHTWLAHRRKMAGKE